MGVGDVVFVLGCFRCMFKVFHQDVAYVAMTIYVRCSLCFKCFGCFRRMFQVFHLDVA
jgi:hypothetical protein